MLRVASRESPETLSTQDSRRTARDGSHMSDESKIIIDDDFKSQVAAEKEALKQEAEAAPPDSGEEQSAQSAQPTQMPPASFELLVSTFATEAMMALGQFPNPVTNELSVSPDHASYAIDMLAMLKDKTKGNLSDAEETMLIDVLHQLRMAFIAVKQQMPSA